VEGPTQQLFFGFLVGNITLTSLLDPCPILLGFHNLGSKIFLEDDPLALGPDFGLLVEFWSRISLLKTRVHVAIALGTTRGIITKTPPTICCKNIS
jgi:hypothetical protein